MELQAKDLRIGNLVDETGDVVTVGLDTFKLWNELNLGQVLKPIPLTKEWLNKTPIEWRSNYHVMINEWLEICKVGDEDIWAFFIDNKEIRFEYVHQLQNFFNSTGEELTIK